MKKDECCNCSSLLTLEGYLFENDGKVYCLDCLSEKLHELDTARITEYYVGGEYIGNDNNIDEVIKNIVDNTDVTLIEEE